MWLDGWAGARGVFIRVVVVVACTHPKALLARDRPLTSPPDTQTNVQPPTLAAIEPFIWSLASKAGHKHRYLPLYLWGVLCILVRVTLRTRRIWWARTTLLAHPHTPLPTNHPRPQGPFELVGRISNIRKGLQPPRPENLLPFLQLALAVWGQRDWHAGSRRWLLMHVVSSVLMGLEALPLHHSDYSWTDGK